MSGNVCYICHDDDGALISECSCRGTSGNVHAKCLLKWFSTRGEWFDLDCPQCKHPFCGQIGVDLASLALSTIEHGHVGHERIRFRSFREKWIASASALENLAFQYNKVGDHQKEKELLERALTIKKRVHGPEHVDVAATLGFLGNAFGRLGDYPKQKELLERALSIQEREYGPQHVEVGLTLGNLGTAFGYLGDELKAK